MAEEALLGAGLFFIAAAAAEAGVEFIVGNRIQQGDRLQFVPTGAVAFFLDHAALIDAVLHAGDLEVGADGLHEFIAVDQGFREVMPGVDVEQGEGQAGRVEGLPGQPGHHD